MNELNEEWTVYVVGRLHKFRIPRKVLASECGYTLTYLSLVLNGNKHFSSERAKERTKEKILRCLRDLENEKKEKESLNEYSNQA